MLLQPPEYLVSTCQCMGLTRKVGLFVVNSAPYNLFQYHIMCSFLMHYVALSALLCIVFSFRTPLRAKLQCTVSSHLTNLHKSKIVLQSPTQFIIRKPLPLPLSEHNWARPVAKEMCLDGWTTSVWIEGIQRCRVAQPRAIRTYVRFRCPLHCPSVLHFNPPFRTVMCLRMGCQVFLPLTPPFLTLLSELCFWGGAARSSSSSILHFNPHLRAVFLRRGCQVFLPLNPPY